MKKKILFIIWSFTYGGGAEKILANIVNNMDLNKYEIDILEYWHADINNEKLKKGITLLPPILDSTKDNLFKMHYYKYLLEHNPEKLRKKYINKKYDYEISFNYLIPTFLLSQDAYTISWVHGSIEDLKKNKRNYKLQKESFANVNKIVAISQKTYNSILDVYPEYENKTTIINNGFDFSKINALTKSKKIAKSKKFTFLFAGRFDINKNPLYLLEVAKKLKSLGEKFEIWLLGQGNLEDKIREKIKEYNLEKSIKILGYQKNPYPYFNAADAILMCSKSEGFPTVLAEGLALGKPFVSTDVGGVIELSCNNECGFVASNFDEYCEYASKLINDKKLYDNMVKSAKENIKKFTIKKQIEKLEELFKEIEKESK